MIISPHGKLHTTIWSLVFKLCHNFHSDNFLITSGFRRSTNHTVTMGVLVASKNLIRSSGLRSSMTHLIQLQLSSEFQTSRRQTSPFLRIDCDSVKLAKYSKAPRLRSWGRQLKNSSSFRTFAVFRSSCLCHIQ